MGHLKFTHNNGSVFDSRGKTTIIDDNGDSVPVKDLDSNEWLDPFTDFMKQQKERDNGQISNNQHDQKKDQGK